MMVERNTKFAKQFENKPVSLLWILPSLSEGQEQK